MQRVVSIEVGLRVVRGRDWKWDNQDDGEGHVGTVVEIGKSGSTTSPDKTVVVQWDSGSRTNYRVGYQGAYDLRIFDNAPVGVKHQNIICDACRKHGIPGIRWKCTQCYDFDLCSQCYMADKHDVTHSFLRHEALSSTGVEMGPRFGALKIQARGIFVGAKVVRGPDWDWGNQDGGDNKTGRVIDIRGWDNESGRSVANVTWTSGSTNVYRLGHKGKVDLKYVQEASGGFYYRDHLPVLGESFEQQAGKGISSRNTTFNVGDKVKVLTDIDVLKSMQEGHGGWNQRMADYIGKIGIVHRVTERGDIRVQFDGCNNRWTFHPGTLTKVNMFCVGDMVTIIDDVQAVKNLQKGHGEWIDVMKNLLGKNGKVLKVYSDGDLRINVGGQTWTFNSMCVVRIPGSAAELNNTMTANEREEPPNSFASTLTHILDQTQESSTTTDRLVREAAQGHTEIIKELLKLFPEKVDHKSSGKTALQVASHQGHMEIVELLLASNANLEVQDDDGDTALHYSSFGNQPEIMELLLSKGAKIDVYNKGKCSALHVAVNKQHLECVAALLRYNCNINIQDSYGDTALHDAIGKESTEIIDMLINVPTIDFSLRNRRGFNALHHASLKGNTFAAEKLLVRSRQIVDIKKDDGFAALHLAALNGHHLVAETLLTQGQCEIDIRNNRKQTPLLLAVSQGHCSLVELLVTMGADINAEDEDGDTGLHLSLMRYSQGTAAERNEHFSRTIELMLVDIVHRGMEENLFLAIACFLAQDRSNLLHQNHQGKTPLDLLNNDEAKALIEHYAALKNTHAESSSQNNVVADDVEADGIRQECVICYECPATVKFEPCNHQLTCEECCLRMKKCIKCQEVITAKIATSGQVLAGKPKIENTERLQYLENKIQEIEEAHGCSICMERRRNVVFLCGHGACMCCAQTLKICHMCRKPISKKINLY